MKKFYMPEHSDFGVDPPEHYGTLTYYDADGVFHEEKTVSERGDYGRSRSMKRSFTDNRRWSRKSRLMLQMENLENALKEMR